MTELIEAAREWISGDPDPATRDELQHIVDRGDATELAARFDDQLTFGTAGIRGEVGAGPNRMNRAVVIRTTAGLAAYLAREVSSTGAPVIVGFDARPTSKTFAEDAAGVLSAAGRPVIYFPEYAPTPIVAFAAKELGAAAAIVVTASHNPPADNGYKVYGSSGSQIVPPVDAEIMEAISATGKAIDVPRVEQVFSATSDKVTTAPDDLVDRYWTSVNQNRPSPTNSDMTVVYTPIHGVGGEVLKKVFDRAGYTGLIEVPEQAMPDGTFPSVSFPNPEEPGALDLAISLGSEVNADVVIANDPDADRLAAVIPVDGGWRPLSGNELGVLLGDYVLRNWSGPGRAIVVNSIVSSPMLGRIAELRNARHEVTLTGFKWIVNAGVTLEDAGEGHFAFGYEEALGYTVGSTVRDKDGISAALIFCDLFAGLRARGLTPLDRLSELWTDVGMWASAQHSLVRPGSDGRRDIQNAVKLLADNPPTAVGGKKVVKVIDYRTGAEERPVWLGSQDLIELSLGESGRMLVRPSGTESKLKIYVDLSEPVIRRPHDQQEDLGLAAKQIAAEMADLLEI